MGLKYDVASVLERETKTTISNWYWLVEDEPSLTCIPMSQENRCAHLPGMFRDLVSRLNNPLPLGTRAHKSAAAIQHGKLRSLRQGSFSASPFTLHMFAGRCVVARNVALLKDAFSGVY